MSKLEEAKNILKSLGMPKKQCNDRSAYVLLSLVGIKEEDKWNDSTDNSLRTKEIMDFMCQHYGKCYKPNSRETIRKESLHQFVEGAIVISNSDDSKRATNSPKYTYKLTAETLNLIKVFGSKEWESRLAEWLSNKETLIEKYNKIREIEKIPLKVNGEDFYLSPGKHNELQKAIIEEFAPRFAQGAEVLYVGDTKKKDLFKNKAKMEEIKLKFGDHDKLPDVVLYLENKKWIYFIEAVTSVGPISQQRIIEIEDMIGECIAKPIYVTAFLDMTSKNGFKKYIDQIAWETEVWIANNPNHLIHLNGDRFMGPR